MKISGKGKAAPAVREWLTHRPLLQTWPSLLQLAVDLCRRRWRMHKLCILQPWEVLCNLNPSGGGGATNSDSYLHRARVLCCTFARAQHKARRARRPAGEILPRLSSAATRCSRSRYFLDRPCDGDFSNQHRSIDRNQQCSADVTKYLLNCLKPSSLKITAWQLESKKRLPHDAQIESRLRIRRGGLILNWG